MGQSDLLMAVSTKVTGLEVKLQTLEAESASAYQGVRAGLEELKATAGAGGSWTGPPGIDQGRGPSLAKLKSARPADGGFSGSREAYEEFRKSTISWASADYPQVEEYLSWAEEQADVIDAKAIEASGMGHAMKLFNQQFRRELWSFLKPESEARDMINDCGVGDGLEAWRLLRCLCKPRSDTGR